MFDYPVTLTPDEGTVMVTFVDIPEAITFGMDEDEALLQAVDALESALTFYIEDHQTAALTKQTQKWAKDCAPFGFGVWQAGCLSSDDRARHQKVRASAPLGLAHAAN